jgi:hypothetical protein
MESRDHITVYIDPEGLVTIRLPKGVMPDRKAVRSIMAAINAERRYHHDPYQVGVDRRDRAAGDRVAGSIVPVP